MNIEKNHNKISRNSNLEILRILCMLSIVAGHFTAQSGIVENGNLSLDFFYCVMNSLSRVSCSVFVIISAWFGVDKEFDFKKIIHTWLTVIMFTVPLTLYCMHLGLATRNDLYRACFPIEGSPLWFAGYYMVLVLLSPVLNFLILNAPQITYRWILIVYFILGPLYTTVTADLGFFGNDIWILVFLYLTTGYIKKYKTVPKSNCSLAVFVGGWLVLTLGRTLIVHLDLSNSLIWSAASCYFEVYRARMQTIPNLIMAYSLFFLFYGLKIKNSSIVNLLARASLGVYCFHQVPIWYTYLWNDCFKSILHAEILHGAERIQYTIMCIMLTWLIGTVLELIRSMIARLIIEERRYYDVLCNNINTIANAKCGISFSKKQKMLCLCIIVVLSSYFFIIKMLS